jgi:hypothetical protein
VSGNGVNGGSGKMPSESDPPPSRLPSTGNPGSGSLPSEGPR